MSQIEECVSLETLQEESLRRDGFVLFLSCTGYTSAARRSVCVNKVGQTYPQEAVIIVIIHCAAYDPGAQVSHDKPQVPLGRRACGKWAVRLRYALVLWDRI